MARRRRAGAKEPSAELRAKLAGSPVRLLTLYQSL